jgi:hypothetical protein
VARAGAWRRGGEAGEGGGRRLEEWRSVPVPGGGAAVGAWWRGDGRRLEEGWPLREREAAEALGPGGSGGAWIGRR